MNSIWGKHVSRRKENYFVRSNGHQDRRIGRQKSIVSGHRRRQHGRGRLGDRRHSRKKGHDLQIYTEYRAAAVAGSLWTPTVILGIAAAVGMAAHNLATINPDYEIGKNKVAGTVTATYKK
jgi:hypothetical protein